MKKVFFLCALIVSGSAFAESGDFEFTKDDLRPFCENQAIWQNTGIKTEKCLDVSVECSKKIVETKKELSFQKLNEELYACVFDTLKLKNPIKK